MSLKVLMWIDALAAMAAGVGIMALRAPLSRLFDLPEGLLLTQSIIALSFMPFSFYLAIAKPRGSNMYRTLASANLAYGVLCLILSALFFNTANVFGLLYLLIDASIVIVLAVLEWRRIRVELG
ncbi:MAG: hypothetical protein ABL959_13640 [Pyrinomonadaceae bacterium]